MAELSFSTVEHNRIMKEAAEQQAFNGIAGSQNLKNFAAIKYFPRFEAKIRTFHADVLEIMDSCHTWESLARIPQLVDRGVARFVASTHEKVQELSGGAPYTPEIRDIPELYATLQRDFEFRAGLKIRQKRKDFVLQAVLLPMVFLLLGIFMGRL